MGKKMKKFSVVLAFATSVLTVGSTAQGQLQTSSVYTDLAGSSCTLVEEHKVTGATVHRCRGVSGWNLLVLYDDQRMSVTLVGPNRKEHPLDYWDVVTQGFSSLGSKAEWRVRRGNGTIKPVALIVRVKASEAQQDGLTKKSSYLAVAKVDSERSCVTHKISAGPNANDRARQAADKSPNEACLQQ